MASDTPRTRDCQIGRKVQMCLAGFRFDFGGDLIQCQSDDLPLSGRRCGFYNLGIVLSS